MVVSRPSAGNDQSPLDLEEAIAANYDRLTAGQRQVIDRLLADVRYGALVSAPELATAIGTSESTVTRAAQALGFAGFPDLQSRLRASFLRPVQERIESDMATSRAPVEIAKQALLADAAHIRETAEDLSAANLEAMIDALLSARRVLVFGERGSYGLVVILGIGLRLVLTDVVIMSQTNGDLPDQLIGLSRADIVVVISFRRVDRTSVSVLRRAQRIGARTVAITDHLSSPVARGADYTMVARTGQLRLIPSFAAGASLVNALLAAISARAHPGVSDRLREAEELWGEFNSYSET